MKTAMQESISRPAPSALALPANAAGVLNNLTWEHSIVEARKASEKLAWNVTKAALALAFFCVVALALSMPLRQTVTRIVEVDKLTGETNVVRELPAYVSSRNDINDKYWIKLFVIAHERYIAKILQKDFDSVKILSGDAVYTKYRSQFVGPNALQKKLEDRVEIVPTILSITLSSPSIATVRFETSAQNVKNPGTTTEATRYIATLAYHYAPNVYAKERDLIDNPLGFYVNTYQVDPEVAVTTDVTTPPAAKPRDGAGTADGSPLTTLPPATPTPTVPSVPAIGAKT